MAVKQKWVLVRNPDRIRYGYESPGQPRFGHNEFIQAFNIQLGSFSNSVDSLVKLHTVAIKI